MQPRLRIVILPREPQVHLYHRSSSDRRHAERVVRRAPDQIPGLVGQRLRCSEMIGVDVIQLAVGNVGVRGAYEGAVELIDGGQ